MTDDAFDVRIPQESFRTMVKWRNTELVHIDFFSRMDILKALRDSVGILIFRCIQQAIDFSVVVAAIVEDRLAVGKVHDIDRIGDDRVPPTQNDLEFAALAFRDAVIFRDIRKR